MKTTMMFRNIANPRRTTLAYLGDVEGLRPAGHAAEQWESSAVLPMQTANPDRTVLVDAP